MNENLTEIICILDRSTSMRKLIGATIEGFNSLLLKQKSEPGVAKMTLVLFDGDHTDPMSSHEIVYNNVDLNLVAELTTETFVPKGMTALYDSIGRTIDAVKTRLNKTPEDERPGKTIVVVMTDGEENQSVEYTKDTIVTMIKSMEDNYNWSFIFMGAGIDAMSSGGDLGVSTSNTLSFNDSAAGYNNAYTMASAAMTRSRSMSSSDWSKSKKSIISDINQDS